jgi:hypothetical protein
LPDRHRWNRYDTRVRELVIVISDFYLAAGGESDPSPQTGADESLPSVSHMARFGKKSAVNEGWRSWLARWLGRDDLASVAPATIASATFETTPARVPSLGSAAPTPTANAAPAPTASAAPAPIEAAAPPATSAPARGTAWFATPVYLIAGLTSLHLDRRGVLRLSADDSARLAEDFARVFGDPEFSLEPIDSGIFVMRSRASIDATTTEPARAVISDLQTSLPTGPSSSVLRRLGAELEMWLHGHPINQRRASRGEMPVSTLWLWGGGPGSVGSTTAHTTATDVGFGSDPYFVGLWRAQGLEPFPLPDRLPNVSSYPDAQRMALIAEATPLLHANPPWTLLEALADLDRRFIAPAIAALRDGEVSTVVLIANDIKLQINRRDPLRFWRRRPKSGIDTLRVP